MIGYLEGVAVSGRVVSCRGVGYVVTTLAPLSSGDEVRLWVSTQVREDSITLFGFRTEDEVAVFEALVKLPGVGAQTALNILRDVGIQGLFTRDAKLIQKANGVGAKLAARIANEVVLPENLALVEVGSSSERTAEISSTLEALGFPRNAALKAAREALNHLEECEDDVVMAEALRLAREGRGQ